MQKHQENSLEISPIFPIPQHALPSYLRAYDNVSIISNHSLYINKKIQAA